MEKEDSTTEEKPNQWILTVSDDIRIRADTPHNWIIEQRCEIKNGVHAGGFRWTTLGYYPDVSLACSSLFEKHLDLITREKGKRRMKELLQELPECVSRILDACQQLKTQLRKTENRETQGDKK
ncbi:MAG: hypothetical protein PHC68_08400 [Syntrophorhabdaceae bacterium]|nr:hypothetical protein [Syntrophorhabdaceae bacterium]